MAKRHAILRGRVITSKISSRFSSRTKFTIYLALSESSAGQLPLLFVLLYVPLVTAIEAWPEALVVLGREDHSIGAICGSGDIVPGITP